MSSSPHPPWKLEVRAIVAALLAGARYAVRVRLPHAAITALLFRPSHQRLSFVAQQVKEHVVHLGAFAGVYKLLLLCLLRFTTTKSSLPSRPPFFHSFLAGCIGGWYVWGRTYSSLKYQILLYLSIRVLVGVGKLSSSLPSNNLYRPASALVWGAVLALYETHPEVLHASLVRSMDEIYRVS